MASDKKKSTKNTAPPTTVTSAPKHDNPDNICNMQYILKEHPFLSKLIREDGILFECDGQAPAPSKDYAQLNITTEKVILRWWKITLRNIDGSMYPGEIKDSYEDFFYDEVAQREIWRFFGQETLDYCLNLVTGKYDWLTLLPSKIQVSILSFVNLDDIPQISLVSKTLRSLCRHNDLWRVFYMKHYGQHAAENKDLINLAEARGWRHVFFTNRLKLQMQLRRVAQLDRHHPEDPSDLVKAQERRTQLQPSPPASPRILDRNVQPAIRRHSFATRRKSPSPYSPRESPLPDQDENLYSARSQRSGNESPRSRRQFSPASSVRSNAGSTASSSSAQPPVKDSHGSSNHH